MYRLQWQRIFFVSSEEGGSLFERFKNWMQEKHILEVQRTNCFLVEYRRALDLESEAGNQMSIVSYTLYPKDAEAWQLFNEEYRSLFEQDFSEEWFHLQRTGRLICKEIVSVPTEQNNIMNTTVHAEVPAHLK